MKMTTRLALGLILLVGAGACMPEEHHDLVNTAKRQGGFAQIQATLVNAATAQETRLATTGSYTTDVNVLTSGGLRVPDGVTLTVVRADAGGYCMQASVRDVAEPWHVSSGAPPARGGC